MYQELIESENDALKDQKLAKAQVVNNRNTTNLNQFYQRK